MKTLLLFFAFSLITVHAQELRYLTPGSVDLSKIEAPFEPGSLEELIDASIVLEAQKQRTTADCERVNFEVKAHAGSFFGPPYGPLTEAEINHIAIFQLWLSEEARYFYRPLKRKYERPRPYVNFASIKPCLPLERSFAYPSGHAMLARLSARVYGLIYPEKAPALLQRGSEVAFGRVLGGVHYLTDVEAGVQIADMIFEELEKSETFQEDLRKFKK